RHSKPRPTIELMPFRAITAKSTNLTSVSNIPIWFIYGKHRAILVCSTCGCGAIRLYGHYGNYACRFCHRAQYLSQKQNTATRKRLAASKLRLQLGGWPDINEPVPSKPKWKRHRSYNKARKELDKLEAPIKTHRFKQPLSTQQFAPCRMRVQQIA